MVEDCEVVVEIMACQRADVDIVGWGCWETAGNIVSSIQKSMEEGMTYRSSCITRAVVIARKHSKRRRCITFMSISDQLNREPYLRTHPIYCEQQSVIVKQKVAQKISSQQDAWAAKAMEYGLRHG